MLPGWANWNWMRSLEPNVPGFWAMMSGSPRLFPAFTAVIASRSDTDPSLGVRSSKVVVTVISAGTSRASRRSKPRRLDFGEWRFDIGIPLAGGNDRSSHPLAPNRRGSAAPRAEFPAGVGLVRPRRFG